MGHLRGTVQADRQFAGDAAGDVHDGGRGVEDARRVFDAHAAGGEDRPDQRETNLPAMGVADQQQVGVLGLGPVELVGAV